MKISRNIIIALCVLALVALFGRLYFISQEDIDKQYMIGIINPNMSMQDSVNGFIEGMKGYGYIEGRNVTYLRWDKKGDFDVAIADMISQKVDLIYTVTTPPTREAKKATAGLKIPIVFTMYDPVGSGIIDSLAKPGGNLTGVQVAGSVANGIDWLRIVMPSVKKIFVPLKFDTRAAKQSLAQLQAHADRVGMQYAVREVQNVEELREALKAMPDNMDAIFLPHSIFSLTYASMIMDEAIKRKIPVVAAHRSPDVALSCGHDGVTTGIKVSRMAHMVLQGESPANIPTEVVDFFLSINLRHMQAIGVDVTNDVLLQADEIVR